MNGTCLALSSLSLSLDLMILFCRFFFASSFHSLDVLQKHAADHVFQMPQFATDAGKYLPGANFSKRAMTKSPFPIHVIQEGVSALSSPALLRAGLSPYASPSPTPTTKPAQKQIHVHQDYPIKYPSVSSASWTSEIPSNIGKYHILDPHLILTHRSHSFT